MAQLLLSTKTGTMLLLFLLLKLVQSSDENMNFKQDMEPISAEAGKSLTLSCSSLQQSLLDHGIYWFRLKHGRIPETVLISNSLGTEKYNMDRAHFKSSKKPTEYKLIINNFNSGLVGIYYCMTNLNNMMYFGGGTSILIKELKAATTIKTPTTTAFEKQSNSTNKPDCFCTTKKAHDATGFKPGLKCSIAIFAPLAVGCIVLLILLITSIAVCNSIRTRHCPHHYKRRLRKLNSGQYV
ncbi:T-cell surface glycoprotein CD8 alpha chain [Erpetoichthys calabaricus]|uniref:T-cell surface glycoprotein CD8 alpha chain n=1 Tax=Erpetoichthys calabaricus TaxID=27687 RepID=UPI002234D3E3|nr:T-cell surface glycoprotein CD8 alpha chain [Erpetoichthys calabaricus]